MKPDAAMTSDIVRMVLGVARLGENDLQAWWKGHAIDRTGQYVLSSMFRRTWKPAALELDVAAASQMHRELLGRSTALHLFSDLLPFRRWAIGWLAEQKTEPEPDSMLDTLQRWNGDDSTETLRSWCGAVEPPPAEPLGDGLLLGRLTAAEVDDPAMHYQTARLLTAAYLDQNTSLRPPYFDLAR
jgi:hypothetical protein